MRPTYIITTKVDGVTIVLDEDIESEDELIYKLADYKIEDRKVKVYKEHVIRDRKISL